MNKTIFSSGIIFGALAVVLGAFGAHGLEKLVDPAAIATFETGVKYQMYHALLLLILACVHQIPEKRKKWIFYLLVAGIILFSFSIYFLAINGILEYDFRTIAFITPIGGGLLIAAWAALGCTVWSLKSWE